MNKAFALVVSLLLALSWQSSRADERQPAEQQAMAASAAPLETLQRQMTSSWLVIVEGDTRTRTLRVQNIRQTAPQTFALDAVYGWTDENQTAVKAEIIETGQGRQLLVTSQTGSQIVTTQQGNNLFAGTFTPAKSHPRKVEIQRVSDRELADLRAGLPRIIPPGGDVPASCATFVGVWSGRWRGLVEDTPLWITSVTSDCMIRYFYGNPAKSTVRTAKIQDGSFTIFPCGSQGSTASCLLTVRGESIWASYNGMDGNANTVFRRVRQAQPRVD